MTRSIWRNRFLPKVDLKAKRTIQQNSEYNRLEEHEVDFTIEDADLQPMGQSSLDVDSAGHRIKADYKIYTKTYVQEGSEAKGHKPDKVYIYGEWFVVVKVQSWINGLDDHYCVFVTTQNKR